jgi:hypothetical protein
LEHEGRHKRYEIFHTVCILDVDNRTQRRFLEQNVVYKNISGQTGGSQQKGDTKKTFQEVW